MVKSTDGGLVGYFGFGSLVNKHTLRTDYVDIFPATLMGYRRHWQARTRATEDHISLLSIHPDEDCSILGMVVIDRIENIPLVDEREAGYSRVPIVSNQLTLENGLELPDNLYVYIADEIEGANSQGDLLQSYLDAVMQGFRNEYGDNGVTHFIETTAGFDRNLVKDRLQPIYPRSVSLSEVEIKLFDAELERAGVLGL